MIVYVSLEIGGKMFPVQLKSHKPRVVIKILTSKFGKDCIILFKCGICYDWFLTKYNLLPLRNKYSGRNSHVKQYKSLTKYYGDWKENGYTEII